MRNLGSKKHLGTYLSYLRNRRANPEGEIIEMGSDLFSTILWGCGKYKKTRIGVRSQHSTKGMME